MLSEPKRRKKKCELPSGRVFRIGATGRGPHTLNELPGRKKNNANDHGNQSVAKDDTDNIAIEKLVALPLSAEEIENEAGLYSNNDLVQL